MSDLRPLGSEKLPVDEKLKRIMEIANYGMNTKSTINEGQSTKSVEFIKESSNGVYGIVKEKEGYFVKKGLTEGSLDYIGGIFMKNKNKFRSYSEALRRLELISGQESLNEAKKYVLKTKDSAPVADAPVEDVPAEPVADAPVDDAPIDDLPPADSGMEDEIPSDEPAIEPEGEEEGKRSDYMAEIQKFSGKLGQSLRDVKEKMESDDIKYVINMVLSAVNIDALDEEDREEIAERFENKDEFSDEEGMDDIPSEDSMDDEVPNEPSDEELDEIMDKLESFIDTDTIVDEDEIPEGDLPESEKVEEKRIEDIADLSVRHEEVSEMEEDVELDLDELKKEINKNVDDTLSKYFK
jgi:hypothetical protein